MPKLEMSQRVKHIIQSNRSIGTLVCSNSANLTSALVPCHLFQALSMSLNKWNDSFIYHLNEFPAIAYHTLPDFLFRTL